MHVNWKLLTMQFQVRGVPVLLQGDPSYQFVGFLQDNFESYSGTGKGILVELDSTPPFLQNIIDQFNTAFQPPQGLSPFRSYDHIITLHPKTPLVNVKPNHYTHV